MWTSEARRLTASSRNEPPSRMAGAWLASSTSWIASLPASAPARAPAWANAAVRFSRFRRGTSSAIRLFLRTHDDAQDFGHRGQPFAHLDRAVLPQPPHPLLGRHRAQDRGAGLGDDELADPLGDDEHLEDADAPQEARPVALVAAVAADHLGDLRRAEEGLLIRRRVIGDPAGRTDAPHEALGQHPLHR